MDLIGGYLLVVVILFSANFSLFLGNIEINNAKLAIISLIMAISSFVLFNLGNLLGNNLVFLMAYFNYFFIMVSILLFAVMIHYLRKRDLKFSLISIGIVYAVSVTLLASQAELSVFDCLLYALFFFITTFVVYQLTKLLVHAKREYPVILGEYMSLAAILIFIFGMTYVSTLFLDYKMFSPFLILTPTYQLIYIIIFIIAVAAIGVVYNDMGGNS